MGLITFIKNVKYLLKYSVKEININTFDAKEFRDFENKLYENNISLVYYPKIITIEETINELIDGNKSIARFGDGEFSLFEKNNLPFQKYNSKLEKRLKEILISNDDNIMVGINYAYYNKLNTNYTLPLISFIQHHISKVRRGFLNHIDLNKTYYSSEFTHIYNVYINYDFETYFKNLKKIWDQKDVMIVGGETIFNNIDYNIFDNTNSFNHFKAPSKNAFDNYEDILNKIIETTPKTTLVIIILGPTATVLAYDLHKAGYRALDLGHIAKDYDYYMKNIERNDENIYSFFKPD